ncbi:MAG: right-handed parallel beta-helix repeat-containing protein [Candidatus Bathyarchaeales archaeon]
MKSSNDYPVHNLNTGLSYTTIQDAINAPETLSGHTILVQEGTYYENIVIDKSISLMGASENSTVIDGGSTGPVILVNVSNVNVSMFTIRNGIKGIKLVEASGCNFRENMITSNIEDGVSLYYSHNNTFVQNVIANNSHKQPERWHGVFLQWSEGNFFANNTISSSDNGFRLWYSNHAILRNNSLYNNYHNFDVYGSLWDSANWIHDIDSSNTVDGKPIYYWIDQQNREIPSDAGYVGVVNSRNITVAHIEVTNNAQGVLFFNTNNSIVKNTQLYSNGDGICLYRSSNNIIRDSEILNNSRGIVLSTHTSNLHSDSNIIENNTISKNGYGILFEFNSRSNYIIRNDIEENDYGIIFSQVINNSIVRNKVTANSFIGIDFCESSDNNIIENNIVKNGHYGIRLYLSSNDNSIFHNNFVNNTNQVYIPSSYGPSMNVFNNDIEGNYWSNYTGIDLNRDGIGDYPHAIDDNNTDHYPLMGIFSSFDTSLSDQVSVISNSTLEDFQYFESNRTIKLFVSNMTSSQTYGFCRICIPHALMTEPYYVTIDGAEPYYVNYTLHNNGTHTWIYFSYQHFLHEIIIVEEFSSKQILPVFMIALILVAIRIKAKFFRDNGVE